MIDDLFDNSVLDISWFGLLSFFVSYNVDYMIEALLKIFYGCVLFCAIADLWLYPVEGCQKLVLDQIW